MRFPVVICVILLRHVSIVACLCTKQGELTQVSEQQTAALLSVDNALVIQQACIGISSSSGDQFVCPAGILHAVEPR